MLPQVQQELLPVRVEFATLSLYVGLILGATVWGVMADLIGRKLSFNVRLNSNPRAQTFSHHEASLLAFFPNRLPCFWQACSELHPAGRLIL